MDGLQLCRMIRSSRGGDRCVVGMVTAHASSGALRIALQSGVNDYLVKPIGSLLRLRLAIAEQWVENVRQRFEPKIMPRPCKRSWQRTARFDDLIGQTPG